MTEGTLTKEQEEAAYVREFLLSLGYAALGFQRPAHDPPDFELQREPFTSLEVVRLKSSRDAEFRVHADKLLAEVKAKLRARGVTGVFIPHFAEDARVRKINRAQLVSALAEIGAGTRAPHDVVPGIEHVEYRAVPWLAMGRAFMSTDDTEEIVRRALGEKTADLARYRDRYGESWLLMVSGTAGAFTEPDARDVGRREPGFDRVFLLNRLHPSGVWEVFTNREPERIEAF